MSDTSKEPTAFRPVRTKDYWLHSTARAPYVGSDPESGTLRSIMITSPAPSEDCFVTSVTQPSESSSLTKLPLHVPRPTSYGFHVPCALHWWNPAAPQSNPTCHCPKVSPLTSPSSVYGMPLDTWNKYGNLS